MSQRQNNKRPQRPHGPMGGPMGGMGSGEKAKNFRSSMGRLLGYLKPQRAKLIIVMIAAVASVAFTLWGPKVLQRATNVLFDAFMPSSISLPAVGLQDYAAGLAEAGLPVKGEKLMVRDIKAEKIDAAKLQDLMAVIDWEKINLGGLNLNPLPAEALGMTGEQIVQMGFGDALEDGKINFGKIKLSAQIVGALAQSLQAAGDSGASLSIDSQALMQAFRRPIDFGALGEILLFMLGLYFISAIFGWIQQYIMADISRGVIYGLRKQVDDKLARLPLSYYDSSTRGELLSRVTNDIDNISSTLQQNLVQMVTAALTVVGVLIMMFTLNWVMTLICLVILPLVFIASGQIMKRSQKYFGEQWAATGTLNSHIEEMYSGHNIVRVFSREDDSIEAFRVENEKLRKSSFKAQFISGIIMPLMSFVNNLNFVVICVYGGIQVAAGRLDMGAVTAMGQYSRQFVQPIGQTASIMNVLQSTAASAERVFELLDAEEQVPDTAVPVKLEKVDGRVELNSISFRYLEDKPLIENVSLKVEPGQRIAIVGPTGAGKTTIVNLLMRFYELNGGAIKIDGVDVTDFTRDALRDMFGMVLQDTWLFSGTIRENIAYGKLGATDEEAEEAARLAHADHFIRTLSEGYETVVNDDASNISQGQRQLLTIARAFLSDPKILILDEATSSVDTRTEVLIQKAMDKLMRGRTSFIIAHRLSTIRNADIILVMRDGSIVEQGSHESLMAAEGFYAELYNSQFGNEAPA